MRTSSAWLALILLLMIFHCERKYTTTPQETVPPPPSLSSPADSATGVAVDVTLLWQSSEGARAYGLQLSTTSTFDSALVDQSDIQGTSFEVTNLSLETTYFWHVNAKNEAGVSEWSTAWSFITVIDSAARVPAVPLLIAPQEGEVVSTNPALMWHVSRGATSYHAQISSSILFSTLVHESSGITDTTCIVADLPENTDYFWRVRAVNTFGTSSWSVIRSFTTSSSASFTMTYGGSNYEYGESVAETSDGGYVIAGHTRSFGAGGSDICLIKTTPFGIRQWAHTYGGNRDEEVRAVRQDLDGGYVLVGITESFAGEISDIWLVKTDESGNAIRENTFGGSGDNDAGDAQICDDGGYIIAGSRTFVATAKKDVWLIKTDASGNHTWDLSFGGNEDDMAHAVQQTNDNGFIVTGSTKSYGVGGQDVWLIKTDGNGALRWSSTFGSGDHEDGRSLALTADGGYIIAGLTFDDNTMNLDALLIKSDADGVELWYTTYGGGEDDIAHSVAGTTDGGFIIAGYTRSSGAGGSDAWLIKTDGSGTIQWEKTYGGSGDDEALEVAQTDDGGYIIAATTNSFGAGGTDIWLIKTDADGVAR